MRLTLLFGGSSRENLVSVASAQSLSPLMPEADLWFWTPNGAVQSATQEALAAHQNPFETPFSADGPIIGPLERALDQAKNENRVLFLGLHGGRAENGELQVLCELRGVPFTGSGSASSHLCFEKNVAKKFAALAGLAIPETIRLADMETMLTKRKKLVAKPAQDGSSYGLIFVSNLDDVARARDAASRENYLVEPFIEGVEATCAVLETLDGLVALPPIEIVPAGGAFDYHAKYLAAATQEICPGRFTPSASEQIKDCAIRAHRALSCLGYSRSDFIVTPSGPIFIETNTLPGLTKNSLYPKALRAHGLEVESFIRLQIELALRRAQT